MAADDFFAPRQSPEPRSPEPRHRRPDWAGPREGELPLWAGRILARGSELAWRALPLRGEPPVARFGLWASALEATIDDTKAREQLGYRPVITREHGLTALQAAR